jgi:hypothetical protein
MHEERRQHKRVPILLEVRSASLEQHSLHTYDVSLGGCYLDSLEQVSVGQLVHFEIQLSTEAWMPLHAQVVHHKPYIGCGLKFLGLTQTEKDLLARTIERRGQG